MTRPPHPRRCTSSAHPVDDQRMLCRCHIPRSIFRARVLMSASRQCPISNSASGQLHHTDNRWVRQADPKTSAQLSLSPSKHWTLDTARAHTYTQARPAQPSTYSSVQTKAVPECPASPGNPAQEVKTSSSAGDLPTAATQQLCLLHSRDPGYMSK